MKYVLPPAAAVSYLLGDHLRPMQQALVDLPPEVARMANQAVASGGDFIGVGGGGGGQGGLILVKHHGRDAGKG
jgi:hypothetical protein